jgi:uncharacterized protein (AIM24 family)
MFCAKCGTPALEEQNFCRKCGQPLKRPPAAVPPPIPPASSSGIARAEGPQGGTAGVRCDWCGAQVDSSEGTCPSCGAALKLPVRVTQGGWTQLPARKDMTKLQIGNSSCQIEGVYVPAADMKLAPGDSVYFSHHVLLWKDAPVNITIMPLNWKRVFAGMPLIMTQATGPGHIAFSQDNPGELIPVALQPGQSIDVREHLFLVATSNVTYNFFQTGIWFQTHEGKEVKTHYPAGYFMDRFATGQTPGLLILHAGGNVFTRTLAPGQTILVKPTALVFKDPTVQMQLHFEHPSGVFAMWRSWSNRYLWLRLRGPGRIAIQSVYERVEGESEPMTRWSSATATRW